MLITRRILIFKQLKPYYIYATGAHSSAERIVDEVNDEFVGAYNVIEHCIKTKMTVSTLLVSVAVFICT